MHRPVERQKCLDLPHLNCRATAFSCRGVVYSANQGDNGFGAMAASPAKAPHGEGATIEQAIVDKASPSSLRCKVFPRDLMLPLPSLVPALELGHAGQTRSHLTPQLIPAAIVSAYLRLKNLTCFLFSLLNNSESIRACDSARQEKS